MHDVSAQVLLSEVSNAIGVLGQNKTVTILRDAIQAESKNSHLDFVVKMVCDSLSFDPDKISETNRNVKRVHAMQLVCYYGVVVKQMISKQVNSKQSRKQKISHDDIAVKIQRCKQMVKVNYTAMKKTKEDKSNKYFQSKFKEFDAQVKKYIENLNTQK